MTSSPTAAPPEKRPRWDGPLNNAPTANLFTDLSRRRLGERRRTVCHDGLQAWCCPRLQVDQVLEGHDGCVNTVSWDQAGRFLVSGSDDTALCLWDYSKRMERAARLRTDHTANIFHAKFMASGILASCALDQTVCITDAAAERTVSSFRGHRSAVQKLVVDPGNEHTFLSCSEDGIVFQLDRRLPQLGGQQLLDWRERWSEGPQLLGVGINSMASSPGRQHLLLLGGEDPFIWLYDRRRLSPRAEPISAFRPPSVPVFAAQHVTGVAISPDGRRLLGSWSSAHIVQFDADSGGPPPPLHQLLGQDTRGSPDNATSVMAEYQGHCNQRTIKEVAYAGARGELVASGSDDGRLFLWDAASSDLVGLGHHGDSHVINAIAPHPQDLCVASGGIDDEVKMWAPVSETMQRMDSGEVQRALIRNERARGQSRPQLLADSESSDEMSDSELVWTSAGLPGAHHVFFPDSLSDSCEESESEQ